MENANEFLSNEPFYNKFDHYSFQKIWNTALSIGSVFGRTLFQTRKLHNRNQNLESKQKRIQYITKLCDAPRIIIGIRTITQQILLYFVFLFVT